jgi:5-methylcytosine-specific restriction endonuclease McrA
LDEFCARKSSLDGLHRWCKLCLAAYDKEYRAKNAEKKKAYRAERYAKNKDAVIAESKRRYEENKHNILSRRSQYRQANADKISDVNRLWRGQNSEYLALKKAEWARNNPDKVRAISSKRRASELMATPSWADLDEITLVYKLAVEMQECENRKYHVDHIIPLQGKTVCGLHVSWNLQILPAEQNLKKGNKLIA